MKPIYLTAVLCLLAGCGEKAPVDEAPVDEVNNPNAQLIEELSDAQLMAEEKDFTAKLTNEGTSYQQLKDEFRRELAVHYVGRPELTIDAIAALMGFQDNSAFYRSFKKWTGLSPGQFRTQLQANRNQGEVLRG